MTQTNFIPRKFKNIESNDIVDFDTLIQNSSISVILGEPASGKTFQLKEYAQNKNSELFLLKMLSEYKKKDIEQYDIILLDSIDEALLQNKDNDILIHRLVKFIERYKKKKIIITCRYLEWKENFEEKLKEVDKELKVYDIQELSKDDINLLLKANDINDFWDFIEKNHLELLLKNIMIVKHLTSNFRKEYQQKNITYIDIYQKIVEQSIKSKGTKREHKQDKRKVKKLFPIGASLATYMMLNRKDTVLDENINDIENFVDELYQVENKEIKDNDLKKILDTALFEKKGDNFSFFHKSIQEYLTAYFISYKKLDSKTIKNIFAHKLRFYEEFEEVIIYLTNIQPHLFNDFVDFDPFIFRRHPSLTTEQQERLLLSIIHKLKNEEQMIYGKWEYLNGSTLTIYRKIENLDYILQKNIKISEIEKILFLFIITLLEHNYSKQMENYIFNILKSIDNKRVYIVDNFIDKYTFNIRLFEFMKKHKLLYLDEREVYSISFEVQLFQSLYGIDYRYTNDTKVKYTDVSFNEIIILFDYISSNQLEYIAPYLKYEDLFSVLNKIEKEKDDYEEYVLWIIYGILLKYKSKNDLIYILNFLQKKEIYLHSINYEKMILDFSTFADDFWEIYFSFSKIDLYTESLLQVLNISLLDIEKIIPNYPIEENLEKYINFRMILNVDNLLIKDQTFKNYIQNLKDKQKKQRKEWNKDNPNIAKNKANFNRYKNLIQNFSTRNDLCTIIYYADYHYKDDFFNRFKYKDLGDRYSFFIEKAKDEFINDDSHLKVKEKLNSSRLYSTILYEKLFTLLSQGEINKLISTKENYQKLFWHLYSNYNQLNKNYFITISHQFKDELVSLSIESIKLSLEQSSGKTISNFNGLFWIVELSKSLDIFDKKFLFELIEYISKIDINIYKNSKDDSNKNSLLSILLLDNEQYSFIKQLMLNDLDNIYDYLKVLLQINTTKAIKDFYSIYNDIPIYTNFIIEYRNHNTLKPITFHDYDKVHIEPNKIKIFIKYILSLRHLVQIESKVMDLALQKGKAKVPLPSFVRTLKNNQTKLFEKLSSKDIELILLDYYNFFKEYKRPTGGYTVDEYDNIYDFFNLNGLWQYLESSIKHIELLEKLTKSSINRLSIHSKYYLDKVYNLQSENRNFGNEYYKKILDKKEEPLNNITNNNFYAPITGIAINQGTANQSINLKDDKSTFNYDTLLTDLILITKQILKNVNTLEFEKENHINDKYISGLELQKYNVAGENRVNQGNERDIIVKDENQSEKTIIEALRITSIQKDYIKEHYDKLIGRYDVMGHSVGYILIYVKNKNFQDRWNGYTTYLSEFTNIEDTNINDVSNIKVGKNNIKDKIIYHIFINFYSNK